MDRVGTRRLAPSGGNGNSAMTRTAADHAWQSVEPKSGVDAAYDVVHTAENQTNWAEQKCLADLFRHIVGNPFRPYPAPDSWPSAILQLADALYNGQDCGFALNDALLEAGHPDLADHFHEAAWHPKGCWRET